MSRYVNDQLSLSEILKEELDINVRPKQKINCVSPDHADSDASLIYYSDERGSYCFGCGKAYFPLDIIMFARDINYYEALVVAESDYGVELPRGKDSDLKADTRADIARYEKVQGIALKGKKQLANFCLALKSVAEENDGKFNKYLKLKGITNG